MNIDYADILARQVRPLCVAGEFRERSEGGVFFAWCYWPAPKNREHAPKHLRNGLHVGVSLNPREVRSGEDADAVVRAKVHEIKTALTRVGFRWRDATWTHK